MQIYSWMDSMVAGHPNLISKVQIGSSFENRPMYVLKVRIFFYIYMIMIFFYSLHDTEAEGVGVYLISFKSHIYFRVFLGQTFAQTVLYWNMFKGSWGCVINKQFILDLILV